MSLLIPRLSVHFHLLRLASVASFALIAAACLSHSASAQETPYFVTYSHHLEQPGNLDVEFNPVFGTQRSANSYLAGTTEFEYGVKAWWTSEFYLDGQSTFGDSAIFTGFRWENRFRLLMREHWINPVLYLEYENVNEADKAMIEVVGFDSEADFAPPNSVLRRAHDHELEGKLILSGRTSFARWGAASCALPTFQSGMTSSRKTVDRFSLAIGNQKEVSMNLKMCKMCQSSATGATTMAPVKHSHLIPSGRRLWIRSILSVSLCAGAAVCVQAQSAQQGSTDESSTGTSDTTVANTNPSRTIESHSKSGNGTVDKQTLEVLGPDGHYVPSSETETETVQVDAMTTKTVVRTYAWDENGGRQLTQETEEESRTTGNGGSHVVRSISDADGNGSLQVVQREVADTSKISPNVAETKTTVSRSDGYGGFTQAAQTQEVKTRNADDTVQSKTTTLVPDGNGNWEMLQTKEKTIKDDGKTRTAEERTEGRLSESSRTVSKETETAPGEKRKTIETYSNYIPGSGDGDTGMNLNQRITTIQKKDSGGETIEGQVEEPDAGNPSDSPKVTAKTKYVVTYAYGGTQQTKTVEVRDGGGNFYVFETQKTDRTTPAQKPPTSPNQPH